MTKWALHLSWYRAGIITVTVGPNPYFLTQHKGKRSVAMYHAFVSENQKDLERKVIKELSTEKAYEFLKRQVKIGQRLSGTPEALEEFDLIKKTLEGYGLATEVSEFDAHISIPVETEFKILSPRQKEMEAEAFSWSMATPPGGIEGELIFVGYGKAEDYQGKDVKDKIVFASLGGGISRARKTEICIGMKPKAFVTFNNLQDGPIQKGTCKSAIGNPTPELLGPPYVPDLPVITLNNKNGLRLVEMCKQGPVKVWLRTRMDQGWKKTHLLSSALKGTVEAEKFILLAGHYDSWGPEGVLCNAVGISALVEWARVLNQFRGQLNRTIRFVFWGGHELGMGAAGPWYIDHYWEDVQDHLVLYSFLDSVGMKDPTVLESYCTPELQPVYEDVIEDVGLPPYVKGVRFIIPSGADIGTFSMYACVPTNRDVAARDYGPYVQRMDFMHSARDSLDLAAPNMFETAFRTLTTLYLRFCNLPILPLDYSVSGKQILNTLNTFRDHGNKIIDFTTPIHYAERFNQEYARFYRMGEGVLEEYRKGKRDKKQERFQHQFRIINQVLIRLSRVINRILLSGFLKWDSYSVGLYTNVLDGLEPKSIPILEPIKELTRLYPKGDQFGSLLTKLVRERNKVSDALRLSTEIIQSAIKEVQKQ